MHLGLKSVEVHDQERIQAYDQVIRLLFGGGNLLGSYVPICHVCCPIHIMREVLHQQQI